MTDPGRGAGARKARVVFTPSGRRGEFEIGTRLLDAARLLGVDIASICGGRALCGRCQVTCSEGEFQKHGIASRVSHLSAPGRAESTYARRANLAVGRRLSCQSKIEGDLVIDVPSESQVHRQVVRKAIDTRPIEIDPVVSLHLVAVPAPDLGASGSDLSRLLAALAEQWQLRPRFPARLLPELQTSLRAGAWQVTLAIAEESEILAIWPGLKTSIHGLAVDVGSTTVAAHLCDLTTGEAIASEGCMNPQIRFGEDLMSRVSYVMLHPEGQAEMTEVVRSAIDRLAGNAAGAAGIAREDILSATFVCNPVMHHLLLGVDPSELGGAPFALAIGDAVHLPAADLDLNLNPGAVAYMLPCIAGHVGADAAGMVLSEAPHKGEAETLLVDIGTNAEIVLGNRDHLLACSSPTGPAFEGAQISAGQRAAPGAIERVRIDRDTLEPRFRVIGSDLWSHEAGFAESLPEQGVTGICGSGIIEAVAELWLAGVVTADGVIDGALVGRSARLIAEGRTFSYVLHAGSPSVHVTQQDIRQIQLAKAALYAGVKLLMERLDLSSVQRIRLAGAFGSHIDVRYAMALGLIPDCPLDAVASAGNAAGHGARVALLNRAARAEIEALVQQVEKVETAVEPRFQAHFVEAMPIPHGADAFPHLPAAFGALPERSRATVAASGAQVARRKRRRRA